MITTEAPLAASSGFNPTFPPASANDLHACLFISKPLTSNWRSNKANATPSPIEPKPSTQTFLFEAIDAYQS